MEKSDVVERAHKLVEKLFDSMINVNGKPGVPFDTLNDLVVTDPEATATAVPALLKVGDVERGAYQIALSLARAYEDHFEDDSLVRLVEQKIAGLAKPLSPLKYLQGEDLDKLNPSTRPLHSAKVNLVSVDAADLEACDTFPLVRVFKVNANRVDKQLTRGLRSRFILGFPVDRDPRPIWKIPSVRAYVAKLCDQVPYMPYYLESDPRAGMFLTFFAPLAELTATTDEGFDLFHEAVVERIVNCLRAVQWLAALVDDDARAVCQSILQITPAEFQEIILSRL